MPILVGISSEEISISREVSLKFMPGNACWEPIEGRVTVSYLGMRYSLFSLLSVARLHFASCLPVQRLSDSVFPEIRPLAPYGVGEIFC